MTIIPKVISTFSSIVKVNLNYSTCSRTLRYYCRNKIRATRQGTQGLTFQRLAVTVQTIFPSSTSQVGNVPTENSIQHGYAQVNLSHLYSIWCLALAQSVNHQCVMRAKECPFFHMGSHSIRQLLLGLFKVKTWSLFSLWHF